MTEEEVYVVREMDNWRDSQPYIAGVCSSYESALEMIIDMLTFIDNKDDFEMWFGDHYYMADVMVIDSRSEMKEVDIEEKDLLSGFRGRWEAAGGSEARG